jgi:hypothetical protein
MASPAWWWRPPPRPPCYPRPSGTCPLNLPRPLPGPRCSSKTTRYRSRNPAAERSAHAPQGHRGRHPGLRRSGRCEPRFTLGPCFPWTALQRQVQHAPATASPHGLRRRRSWPATPTSIVNKRSLTNGFARALQPPPVVDPNCWTAPASRLLSAPAGGGQRSQSGADQELCVDCNEGGVMIVTRQYSRQTGRQDLNCRIWSLLTLRYLVGRQCTPDLHYLGRAPRLTAVYSKQSKAQFKSQIEQGRSRDAN